MLLQLGARVGSLVTVLDDEWLNCRSHSQDHSKDARKRRWVYFRKACLTCGLPVRCWTLGGRICFACESCQLPWQDPDCALVCETGEKLGWKRPAKPSRGKGKNKVCQDVGDQKPDISTEESSMLASLKGLAGPAPFTVLENSVSETLNVARLRQLLAERLLPTEGLKAVLVERFNSHRSFHDKAGFAPVFFGKSEELGLDPWPPEPAQARAFAAIHCWRTQESIHAWVQQDPKRYRYGRLSGRIKKPEGQDLDLWPEKEKDAAGKAVEGSGPSGKKRKARNTDVNAAKPKRRQKLVAKKENPGKVRKFARLSSVPTVPAPTSGPVRLRPSGIFLDLCDLKPPDRKSVV